MFCWYSEFERGRILFGAEKSAGRSCSSVIVGNIERLRRMIDEKPECIYQAIDATLGVAFTIANSILHDPFRMNTNWYSLKQSE